MREVKLSQNSWIALIIAAIVIVVVGIAAAFMTDSINLIQEIDATLCSESVSGLAKVDDRVGICQGGNAGQVLSKLPSGLIGWADPDTGDPLVFAWPSSCAPDTKADSIDIDGLLSCSSVDTGDILNATILAEDIGSVNVPDNSDCLKFINFPGDSLLWEPCSGSFVLDPADCAADTKADAIDINGDLTCSQVDTGDILDDTITPLDIDYDYLVTPAGIDLPLEVNEVFFASSGIIFEGSVDNAQEGILRVQDITFDTIWDLPDLNGTILIEGYPDSIGSIMMQYDATLTTLNGFASGESFFASTGIIFEGSSSDAVEGLLTVANPTSSDKTWTLPDTSGTIITTGDTGTVTGDMIADATILPIELNDAADTPADEECLTYETTGSAFEWQTCGSAGSNSFETQNVPSGTDPVAESGTDTLNWTSSGSTITITGNSGTDTINLEAIDVTCTGCLGSTEIADNAVGFTDIDYSLDFDFDPPLGSQEAYFSNAGIIFEAPTADTIEGLLEVNDLTGTDKVWTLPNASGVILLDSTANIFQIMDAPSGTDPIADSTTDTLAWTSTGSTIAITGDSGTDTINLDVLTAPALSANPTDCAANQFANAIDAEADLTCAAIADADVPNTITINLAATATALASDPTDCGAGTFADAIAASGNLTCNAVVTGDITDGTILPADLSGNASFADEECITFESTGPTFEGQTCASGTSIIFDIGDDGGNDSTAVAEIATTGDTNAIFTESAADKILIAVGNNWPTADAATALSANPADCAANQFANVIAANGNLTCAAIADADVPDTITINLAATATALASDPTDCAADTKADSIAASGNLTCSGVDTGDITNGTIGFADIDFSISTGSNPALPAGGSFFGTTGIVFEGATADAFEGVLNASLDLTGDRSWDLPDRSGTIITSGDSGTVTSAMILNDAIVPDDLSGNASFADEECITFESTGPTFEGQACGGGGSNSFETQNVPSGTDPVAESSTDTLNWTSTGSTITLTGDSTTDTINVEAVDVTCTGCLGTTEIAGLDISADTNLTAGRSLTLTGDDVLADAELYTSTLTIWIENPTAADDLKTIWTAVTNSYTITAITCESDQTVTFDLQIDDGTPAAVNGSDIACTTYATDSTLAGDTGLDAGERLDLAIASVANTPTWVSISWTVTVND